MTATENTTVSEGLFHLSVIKWLSDRDYKFWWEVTLPNSRLRADFLAYSPDGERMLIECKVNQMSGYRAIDAIPSYLAELNDDRIHSYIAVPSDLYLTPQFVKGFETFYTHILRIPVNPITDIAQCNTQPIDEIGKYFHAFNGAKEVQRTGDYERVERILSKAA